MEVFGVDTNLLYHSFSRSNPTGFNVSNFDVFHWIFGVHIFIAAWVLLGYVIWLEITTKKETNKWMNLRLMVFIIITLILLKISIKFMNLKV
jgi:predicted nucleic-acid-binding protein